MRETNSYKSYSKLASSENDPDKRSGRNIQKNSKYLNKLIFNDSFQKLTVKRNQSILSIGIGCGELSRLWLEKSAALNLSMTFVDFPLATLTSMPLRAGLGIQLSDLCHPKTWEAIHD